MAQLGDLLADAAGAHISRPALDAYVTQGQAMAGLRTAQTEDALVKAQQGREEMQAQSELESALGGIMTGSQAKAAATMMRSHFGTAKDALDALTSAQALGARGTLGDVSQLGTPAQTAAQQVVQGKVAEPVNVPDNYTTLPGMPTPNVQQSPLGTAKAGEQNALAGLHQAETNNPGAFHPNAANAFAADPTLANDVAEFIRLNPNLATNMRSLVSNGGPQVVRAFLRQNAGAQGGIGVDGKPVDPNEPAHQPPNGIVPAPGISLKEQADIRNDFSKGTGAKQSTYLNTMVSHSNLFDMIADQMQNNDFTPTNAIANLWKKTFGSPVPTNLKIAAEFLGREAVRATVNSGSGTGEERELAVGPSSSPEGLHGAAQTLRALAAGQARSLELRARRGGVDITQLFSPDTQSAFGMTPGGAAPAATPSGAANDPLGIRGAH